MSSTPNKANSSSEINPPFLPLEEQGNEPLLIDYGNEDSAKKKTSKAALSSSSSSSKTQSRIKALVSLSIFLVIAIVCFQSLFSAPEDRWIRPEATKEFLAWVQEHPGEGIVAFLGVFAVCVIFILPVGTPLTMGCGFVYKGAYGWTLGVSLATIVSMTGSAVGAASCFLLGRYLMREQVRNWIRNYPLFQAIDVAAAEHGMKILAMLYLTPIAPLGPLSYMCGTTSMTLTQFLVAKIASLPIMTLYVFIGASAGALIGGKTNEDPDKTARQLEENPVLIVLGILVSVVMLTAISVYIKKELKLILEREPKKKEKGKLMEENDSEVERRLTGDAKAPRHRHRISTHDSRDLQRQMK